jgi:hypothetical protein
MDELATALDDLAGLHEAICALLDNQRVSPLARKATLAKKLRQDVSAGTEAYLSTLISSPRGELDRKRVRKCRSAALAKMPVAVKNRLPLAALVEERRLPSHEFRHDLGQLLTLSLHCRAALAALAPTVDRRAAEALGNKVLVELRESALLYVATARTTESGGPAKARAAVAEHLKKTESHASELAALAPGASVDESLGAILSKDVGQGLHKTALDWSTVPAQAS